MKQTLQALEIPGSCTAMENKDFVVVVVNSFHIAILTEKTAPQGTGYLCRAPQKILHC